jgi:hypothetical protein
MVAVETLNMRMTNPCSLFLFLYCFLGYTTCIDPPSKILSPSSFIEYTIQVHYSKKKMIHRVPNSVFFLVGRQIFTFFQPEKYDFNTDKKIKI